MDTSRISRKADEFKTVPSVIKDRSSALLGRSAELRDRSASMLAKPRRPAWRIGMVWFAGGMAIASLVAFFFESTRGSARRHMAYDKAMAAGRDMGQWSGRRVRHLRNKAMGTVAEIKSSGSPEESGRTAGSRL